MDRRPCLCLALLMHLLLCRALANVTGIVMLRRLGEGGGVFCYLSVSNTINIITYTDV